MSSPPTSGSSIQPCRHFLKGHCPYGKKCRFLHTNPDLSETLPGGTGRRGRNRRGRETAPSETQTRLNEPLSAAQSVTRHTSVPPFAAKAREAKLEEKRALEAQVTVQQVVLGSALVTCGAGIDIRSIITGFDLNRVVVKDISPNANLNEAAAVFTQAGLNPENVFLEDTKPNGRNVDATFLVKADEAEMFALSSDRTIDFQGQRLGFEVGPVTSGDSMALSSKNTKVLTVYWRVPSTSIIATYPTLEIAKAKAKELDAKMFSGRRVKAVMNTPPLAPHNWRQYNPASVKLMNLPLNVPLTEVEVFSGALSLRVLQSPTYIPEEFLDFLCRHLEGLPGVIRGTFARLPSKTSDSTSRVEIKFHSWEEAMFACDTLNNHRLRDDYPYIHTLLPRAHQYFIDIPHEQYHAQKSRWNLLAKERGNGMARLQVNERNNGRVVITVEGNDRKAVGALKVRVEGLVTGERLDPGYWDRVFFSDTESEVLQQVHAESGAYVRINKKIRTLRVYGDAEAVVRAKEMIKEAVGFRQALLDRDILLKQRSVQYFVRRGLASLREIIGEENISLDLASTPCKVILRGGDEARHHLSRVIDESLADHNLDEGPTDICPICCDTVSHPESLGCGHSYCVACLWHYLESAANTKRFPLVCMGNNATCGTPISIPLIKKFLTVQRFNQLVEVAFLSYLDQHPRELKYCTTPDCSQIYRRELNKPFLQCPACFSTICPSCQEESHEGMTCLQWRRYNPTAGQEWFTDDWASPRGIKKCPGCGIWIEKTEGCNHLTCRCGDHVCWKCMGIFTAETIYAHMHKVHGEIHDEPPRHDQPSPRALEEQLTVQILARVAESQRLEREQQAALQAAQTHEIINEQRETQRLRAMRQAHEEDLESRRQHAEAQLREEARLENLRNQEVAAEYQRQSEARQWEALQLQCLMDMRTEETSSSTERRPETLSTVEAPELRRQKEHARIPQERLGESHEARQKELERRELERVLRVQHEAEARIRKESECSCCTIM